MAIYENKIPELELFNDIMNRYQESKEQVKFTRKKIIVPMDNFVYQNLSVGLAWLNENYAAFKMSVLFSVDITCHQRIAVDFVDSISHHISYQTRTSFYRRHDLSEYQYKLTEFQTEILKYLLLREAFLNPVVIKMLKTIEKQMIIPKTIFLKEAVDLLNESNKSTSPKMC